jgi:4-amino-4-deoxy-L-arabinose transferase-like glycosyltransferase
MTLPALPFLDNKNFRIRFWWPLITLVAVFSYFYHLDGLHIPKIGDEAPYYHITRLTAESGHWLPLQGDHGLQNTKPPLLFWQGMVSTNMAADWTLERLRLPIVIYSLLTALLAYLLAIKISGDREKGFIAALSFLGFASTFQHGRPFLTNLPETFFIFLCFFLLVYFWQRKDQWKLYHWALLGLALGIATLYRSFIIVVPVGFAMLLIQGFERNWNINELIQRDLAPISLMVIIALLCFSLWPLLDPHPENILQQFILGQNVSKLDQGNYFHGLFSGPYPLTRIWLGQLTNAGLLMFVLVGVVIVAIRNRSHWSGEERTLWLFVLAYLVVYSVPSQRQENYLLPTTPALGVLMALHWHRFKPRTWAVMAIPIFIGVGILTWLFINVPGNVSGFPNYDIGARLFMYAGWLLIAYSIYSARHLQYTINLLVFYSFILLAVVLSPLEGKPGRYNQQTIHEVAGETIYMPAGFGPRHERYRFILPGANIRGYNPNNQRQQEHLLQQGYKVGIYLPVNHFCDSRYQVYGRRLDLKTRQTPEEVKDILFNKRLDLLFQQELIVSLKVLSA